MCALLLQSVSRGAASIGHASPPVLWTRLPNAIPRSDAEVYELMARKVLRLVRRKVKFGISHPDAVAEIWARLLRGRVLDRFVVNRLLQNPSLTRDDFERYAYRAADNHLKNVFRTLARRANRERLLGDEALESRLARGRFAIRYDVSDPSG